MTTSSPWYATPKNDAHGRVFETAKYIRRQSLELREDMIFWMEAYANGNVAGLGGLDSSPIDRLAEYMYRSSRGTTRFNLIAALVDTAVSLISQQPAIPQYLTTDGDFALIRRAEKCSQVLQGQMSREVQETCKRAHLDACKVGTGFVHGYICPETGLPKVERVHPLEVLVEHLDGLYGRPRSMHRSRLVPKETLKAHYPAQAHTIEACVGIGRDSTNEIFLQGLGTEWSYADFVEVLESWHTKAGKKGRGRHTICIANVTLVDEDYDLPDHPFAVFRYRVRDFGFFGSGLSESAIEAQNRVNDLIARVTRGQDLGSSLVVLNPNGENAVSTEQFTNDLGLIINYDATVGPPQMVTWSGTMDDLQQQIDLEFQRALAVEGLSQQQVSGQGAGRGLDSGVAVRAADDVQSRRLVPYVNRYQDACIMVARLFEALNDVMSDLDAGYVVSSEAREAHRLFLASSRWVDVRLPKGNAKLTMGQMSALPTTPSAKYQAVMEWIQAGFVSRNNAMSLLDFPDLDAYSSTELAHLEYARWQIIQILDSDGAFVPTPDPRQDLALAIDLATKSKLKAETMSAPEPVLFAFEDYIVAMEDLQLAAQPPAPAAMPGAAPGAAPGAPPAVMPGDLGLGLPMGTKGVVAPGLAA